MPLCNYLFLEELLDHLAYKKTIPVLMKVPAYQALNTLLDLPGPASRDHFGPHMANWA